MISKEDKEKAYAKLNMGEVNSLKDLQKELEAFIKNHEQISIEGLNAIASIQKSLDIIKDLYLLKVLNLLKQGNELD